MRLEPRGTMTASSKVSSGDIIYIYIYVCVYMYVLYILYSICIYYIYIYIYMYNDICLNLLTSDYMCCYLQWGLSSGIFEWV